MYTGTLTEFLNMGGGEIMLILAVVLLLFGGKKLPELARGLGKGLRDFKDASEGVKREIHRNINSVGITDEINDFKSTLNGEDVNKPHNYDYKPGENSYGGSSYEGGSEYTGDEAAHYNSDAAEKTADVNHTDKAESVEHIDHTAGTAHVDHKEHTKIETDKTKL